MEYDDAGNLTRMDLFGDMNCDGVVSSGDIGAFVMAMTDPSGYASTYPSCAISIGDCNGDGSVTAGDIASFTAAVTAQGHSRVMTYDEENRLTSVTVGSLHLSMGYDAVGRRVLSTEFTGLEEPCEPPATATQVHTRHIYLGLAALEEHRKAICSDTTTVGWALAREFLWGENFPEPVALIDWTEAGDVQAGDEEWLFYLRDVLGSVVGLVTPEDQQTSGTQSKLVERYAYDPYGKPYIDAWDQSLNSGAGGWVRVTQSEFGNPLLWTGQRFDASVGLYHFLFRSYSPELGRWLQRDPLGYVDGVNLYEYVNGSPLYWVDALGLEPNKPQVTGPDQPIEAVRWFEKEGWKDPAFVGEMLQKLYQGERGPRYVWSDDYGWIDLRHFFAAFGRAPFLGDPLIRAAGVAAELKQKARGEPSAFSYEELPSNGAGADFWRFYMLVRDEMTIAEALAYWLELIGARGPEDPLTPVERLPDCSGDKAYTSN